MNRKILFYCVAGFIFVGVLGSLSHFFYVWSRENFLVALVCPVNESTWEHMKLLFFPVILYTLFFTYRCKEYTTVAAAMLLGNILGTACIPVLFYTYSGVYGNHVSFLDIGIFFISVFVVFYLAYQWIEEGSNFNKQHCRGLVYCQVEKYKRILFVVNFILAISFFIFTFFSPAWGIFQEPW